MNCKKMGWNQWIGWLFLAVGVVSFLYGLLSFLIVHPEGKSANTLLGMFTGFGFGIILVGIRNMIHEKRTPKEKLEQEEIDRNDERNIAISRAAHSVGMFTAIILFAILGFVFMAMGQITPSYMCIGSMYVMIVVTKIAQKILEKKM